MRPLEGITVLDFSKVLAGPLCTQSLGDLGAKIIKVEPLGLGDETRGWPPFRREELGAVFLSVNRNKRSIVLDLKSEEGQKVMRRIAQKADVAIETFGTGVAERLGIDAGSLQSLNPRLIHCSISGFGRTGPLSHLPGYDVILQAFSGMMALSGEEGGGYVRSPISPVDQMAGTHALTGILAALLERNSTGKGQTINVSLFQTAVALQRYNLQSFWERGVQPAKCGSSHESLCPYQAFEANDGPILIGIANDSQWRKFCAVAGLSDFVDHADFRTNADRVVNRERTVDLVQRTVQENQVSYWIDQLSPLGVPCAPINSLDQLVSHPHTEASGALVSYNHPHAGEITSVGLPFLYGGKPAVAGSPPPLHGEHTDQILSEFGFTPHEIGRLKDTGAIGRHLNQDTE